MYPIRKLSVSGTSLILNWKSLVICCLAAAIITVNGEDFSPCSGYYSSTYNSYSVSCNGVLMADVAAVFRTKPALNIDNLSLTIRPEGDSIPADLLGQSRFYNAKPGGEQPYCELRITGIDGVYPWLTVDPDVFRSGRGDENSSLTHLFIWNLDTSRMDFQFLSDVGNNLQKIYFWSLFNMEKSLPTLPYLPSLTFLELKGTSDMNKAFSSGTVLQCNGLKTLYIFPFLGDPNINNEAVSQIMNWALPSSANTLESLTIERVNMTRTPLQLASFSNLKSVLLSQNIGNMTVAAGTFFSNKIEFIELSGVVAVEEGTFQGNYSKTKSISIPGNSEFGGLIRFEAAAFKSLLEQMINTRPLIGTLSLYSANPSFDCYTDPCHLAWICRDNRYLLTRLKYATCKGTNETFEEMSPYYFSQCPITDCPSYCTSQSYAGIRRNNP